uniref:Alpha/beta hydrolase fold-3 domain-containing protein n=1 Tax=Chenopodium quinoa TaxID=63459 RepID=A0A803LE32_CHEQI
MEEKPGIDPITGVQTKDIVISNDPAITGRIFLPKMDDTGDDTGDPKSKKGLQLFVHFHGGSFCTGSAFSPITKEFLTQLVSRAQVIAITVNFRLAPEYPLPIAYDDCWAAFKWVASHANGNGSEPWLNEYVDFNRVFVGGESSGANLAHDVAIRASVEPIEKKTTEEEAKTDHLQQEKAGSELVNTGNQSTEDEPPKEATAKDQPTQQVKAIAEDEPPAEEEPPKEDEPPAAVEETHSYIMQKKKLKVSTQGILKKLTKNWKIAPVSKVIAAKKAPATTVDTAGKATAAEMAPATTTEKSSAAEKSHAASSANAQQKAPAEIKKILLGGEEIEIEDETEEDWKDKKNCKGMRS